MRALGRWRVSAGALVLAGFAATALPEDAPETGVRTSDQQAAVRPLDRVEYANAIRDLFDLPLDAPHLAESGANSAADIARLVLGRATERTQVTFRVSADTTQDYAVDGLPFGTRGGAAFVHVFPADGHYTLSTFAATRGDADVRPSGGIKGEQIEVLVDGERVKLFDWDREFAGSGERPATLDVTVSLKAGTHVMGVTFLARHYAPLLDLTGAMPGHSFFPAVGGVRIDGPIDGAPARDFPGRRRVLVCEPVHPKEEAACARRIIDTLATRAYRGKADRADRKALFASWEAGARAGGFERGVEALVARVLAETKFTDRAETPKRGFFSRGTAAVSDLDLAARLSFLVWSSLPDDELLELARKKQLRSPAALRSQVARMLADPRSRSLSERIATEWLVLRGLGSDIDDNLRRALRREAELLVDDLARGNRPVTELLTADYTFVDEPLARHYGVTGVRGSRFRRIERTPELDARRGTLAVEPERFTHDLTIRLLAHAMGRQLLPSDEALVSGIERQAARDGHRFQTLIAAIVLREAGRDDPLTESAPTAPRTAPVPTDPLTALLSAVDGEDDARVRELVARGVDVNMPNREGATALSLAAMSGNAGIVRQLLRAGAKPGDTLPNGETPLMLAARTGGVDALRALLETGVDVDAKETLRGTTALMWAAAASNAPAVKQLIDAKADVAATSARAPLGAGPHLAETTVERLDRRRRGVVQRDRPPPPDRGGGLTALLFAAREGDIDSAKLLLQAGANVDRRSGYGWTPLLTAIHNRHYRLAKVLLDAGADANVANNGGWNALYLATDNRNAKGGESPARRPDMDDLEMIRSLLAKGVNVNARMRSSIGSRSLTAQQWLREEGATPLLRAAQSGDVELVRLLLSKGADPGINTELGVTPLMAACGIGWIEGITSEWSRQQTIETIRLLLARGADVDARDKGDGRTALMGAAHKGDDEAVKMLVAAGARLDARDLDGFAAIDYAEGRVRVGVQPAIAHPATAALLRELASTPRRR